MNNKEKISKLVDDGRTPEFISEKLKLELKYVRVVVSQIRREERLISKVAATPVAAIEPVTQAVRSPAVTEYRNIINFEVDMKSLIPKDEEYITRRLCGNKTDLAMIRELYKHKYSDENPKFPILVGATGSGKNMLIRKLCATEKLAYKRIELTGTTTADEILGGYVPNPDQSSSNKYIWMDGWLVRFMKHGGVLVLDEVNMCNADILSSLHSATDKERMLTLTLHTGETVYSHPDFWIVGTMNPDYEGTKPLNQAFKDRFETIKLNYSDAVETKLNIPKKLLTVVEKLRARPEINTPISTRLLVNFRDNVQRFGEDVAIYYFCNRFDDSEQQAVQEIIDLHFYEKKTEQVQNEQ